MIQLKDLWLRAPVNTPAVRQLFSYATTSDTELYNLFPPDLIISKSNKKRSDNGGIGKIHDGNPSLQRREDNLPALNIKTVIEDLRGEVNPSEESFS